MLSDVDRAIGTLYEVARPPDEKYAEYPMRLSYLIDPEGVIRAAYEVTDVAGHARHVLDDLHALRPAKP